MIILTIDQTNMLVGILHEGLKDDGALKIILEKLFREQNYKGELLFKAVPANGQILTKIRTHLKIFF